MGRSPSGSGSTGSRIRPLRGRPNEEEDDGHYGQQAGVSGQMDSHGVLAVVDRVLVEVNNI